MPQYGLALHVGLIALAATAAILYLIVSILRSLGTLLLWGGGAILVIAAIYWIRRGVLAFRGRFGGSRNDDRRIQAIVRE